MPSPMKSLGRAGRNHRPRQTPAPARRPGSASPSQQDFIGSQQSEITEFDESLVRKLIQQITVYDDHFTVRKPKSGLEIDINE